MKIIIVGCGKVGVAIAKVFSPEKDIHVTVIEKRQEIFDNVIESMDTRFVMGSGLSETTLLEAGAKTADLIIAVTGADEVNILCGIMAEHLGTKHSVARVRNPDYALEFSKLGRGLGIDMVINPEQQTAREISRLLRYQAADSIDTFAGGRVELASFRASETPDFFVGKSVSKVFDNKMGVLAAVVERQHKALIPRGDLVFEQSDIIRILGRPSNIAGFFALFGKKPKRTKEIIIIGGGKITHYLAELLDRHTMRMKLTIIEKVREKCEALALHHPRCLVVHGDGTDEDVLDSVNIGQADAVICLTDRDEENAVISLYASRLGVKKVITKINHIDKNMMKSLGLNSIVTPHSITSDFVARFVTGLAGAVKSNARTMHRVFDGNDGPVEALEFHVQKKARCLNIPLKDLRMKTGVLIGCIVRGAEIIIPTGETKLQTDDAVIVIAKNSSVDALDDILIS